MLIYYKYTIKISDLIIRFLSKDKILKTYIINITFNNLWDHLKDFSFLFNNKIK